MQFISVELHKGILYIDNLTESNLVLALTNDEYTFRRQLPAFAFIEESVETMEGLVNKIEVELDGKIVQTILVSELNSKKLDNEEKICATEYAWSVDEPQKSFRTKYVELYKDSYNPDTFTGDMAITNINPSGEEIKVLHRRMNGVVVGMDISSKKTVYELLHTDSSSYRVYINNGNTLVETISLVRG